MWIVPIIKSINWNMSPHHVQQDFYRQTIDWTWSPVSRLIQLIIQLSFNLSIKNLNRFQGLILGMHWSIILSSTHVLTISCWLNVKSRSIPKICEPWRTHVFTGEIIMHEWKHSLSWYWMYKEKKGMGLDSPLMPNKLPGFIFFLPPFFSSSSPSLGKVVMETFDQRARKDLKKCIWIYQVLVS